MCADTDLFGQVVVTYDDVELFLRTIPRLKDDARINALQSYIKNYDVVEKIKQLKQNNQFPCFNSLNRCFNTTFCSINNTDCCEKTTLSSMIKDLNKPHFMPLPILPASMIKSKTHPLRNF